MDVRPDVRSKHLPTCTTYQLVMIVIFNDMIYDCLAVYVDDVVVKSNEEHDHIDELSLHHIQTLQFLDEPPEMGFQCLFKKILGKLSTRKESILSRQS